MELTITVKVSKFIGDARTQRETSANVCGIDTLEDLKGVVGIVLCRVAQNAEGDNNAN